LSIGVMWPCSGHGRHTACGRFFIAASEPMVVGIEVV
jgi:hypothetical protein